MTTELQKLITQSKQYIYNYEFRKNIFDIGNNTYKGTISVPYKLLTETCNIFKYFRDNGDSEVKYIAYTFNVILHFNFKTARIEIFNKVNNIQLNYKNIESSFDVIMKRIENDMNYLYKKDKLPKREYKKRLLSEIETPNDDTLLKSIDKKQKTQPVTQPAAQPAPQPTAFPGLVMVIDTPTPELVSKLFTMNINYTFLPQFLIKQMLDIQQLPPPHLPPPQIPSPPFYMHQHNIPMHTIPPSVLPRFISNHQREEGEIP